MTFLSERMADRYKVRKSAALKRWIVELWYENREFWWSNEQISFTSFEEAKGFVNGFRR